MHKSISPASAAALTVAVIVVIAVFLLLIFRPAAKAAECGPSQAWMTVFEVETVPHGTKAELMASLKVNAYTKTVKSQQCMRAVLTLENLRNDGTPEGNGKGIDRNNRARVIDIACRPCWLDQSAHYMEMELRRHQYLDIAKRSLNRLSNN